MGAWNALDMDINIHRYHYVQTSSGKDINPVTATVPYSGCMTGHVSLFLLIGNCLVSG